MLMPAVELPLDDIARLCAAHEVAELSLFGSALTGQFRPDSDLDFLIVFTHPERIGIRKYLAFQLALARLLVRDIDLVPKNSLKPTIREHVLASAWVLYAA